MGRRNEAIVCVGGEVLKFPRKDGEFLLLIARFVEHFWIYEKQDESIKPSLKKEK